MKHLDHWQIQEAKSRLSQLVKSAQSTPQFITVHGQETAVILSIESYHNLMKTKGSLVDFFQQSPLCGVDLSLEREQDYGRDIDL